MSLVLNVEILGEYKNLAKATKGAQGSFDKLGEGFAKVGKNIAKVTAGIAIGLGAAVASQIKPAIDAASDLSEGINAVNVSFGDAAEGVLKLGENAAKGLGLSKTELYGIATQFSSFANTIAGEGGNIVQVVDDISNRGADFASVFNLDVSDALAKFQSGLAGSSEPLRAYGIDLSAATVEAHALEMGIWDGTDAMTESEKVQARYSSLMEQTDKVTGDFANTSDGLANQQRILKATLEDTRAEIGEKFMPIMQGIQTFILEKVIPAFTAFWEELIDPNGEAQTQLRFTGEAMKAFAETFDIAANDITSQQVFKWIGDQVISTMKVLTHLSVFTQEVFGALGTLFTTGHTTGEQIDALKRLIGAAATAQKAADAIQFAPDITSGAGNQQRQRNMTPTQRFDQFGNPIRQTSSTITPTNTNINININRAKVDAQDIIRDINATLKTQGSTRLLR
jgi:hypothetical protein